MVLKALLARKLGAAALGAGYGLYRGYKRAYNQRKQSRGRLSYRTRNLRRIQSTQRPVKGNFGNYVPRNLLPPRWPTTMTWVMGDSLASAALITVTGTQNRYALNSIHQPNQVSVTANANHSARGHNEYKNIYSRYFVYGVKITITWWTNETTDVLAGCSLLTQSNDATSITATPTWDIQEMDMGSVCRLAPSGENRYIQSCYVHIGKLEGRKLEMYNMEFSSAFDADPARLPQLHVAVANETAGTADTLNYTIQLDFDVIMYEKKTLAFSTNG